MHLEIEDTVQGPLTCKRARIALEDIAASAADLDEVATALRDRFGPQAVYRGTSHVALHRVWKGKFLHGVENRVALITNRLETPLQIP